MNSGNILLHNKYFYYLVCMYILLLTLTYILYPFTYGRFSIQYFIQTLYKGNLTMFLSNSIENLVHHCSFWGCNTVFPNQKMFFENKNKEEVTAAVTTGGLLLSNPPPPFAEIWLTLALRFHISFSVCICPFLSANVSLSSLLSLSLIDYRH